MMSKNWHEQTALALGAGISNGTIDPVDLTEHFLARIAAHDPKKRTYLRTTPARARAEAIAARKRTKDKLRLSPLDGVPISWKDLFDTAGDVTAHGSLTLQERVAPKDAALVSRATRAGLICLGKTNQTEFAYSILGINPMLGTPSNACDAKVARVPGGSSSGAAISVAAGLAAGAIGSDTGGSVRAPASWNGLVGLKTTFGRLPLDGALALSPSMDSAGPLTRDVADAAALFAILDGRFGIGSAQPPDLTGASLGEMALLKPPRSLLWSALDDSIGAVVETALAKLARAGAGVKDGDAPEFDQAHDAIVRLGPYHAAEAYAIWKDVIEARPNLVFGPILERLRFGATLSATTVQTQRDILAGLAATLTARIKAEGAIVAPTMALSPPPIAALETDMEAYATANLKGLRNTRLVNFLGLCAITVPCGLDRNGLPVGLMLIGAAGWDERLLRMAKAIESALAA
ncbi:MAG: amidase [Alphaproteobacteria bacterium]|nr:amidase [Alphaproteobacteria bacterium]